MVNLIQLTQQEVRDLRPTQEVFHVKLWRLWQPAPQLIWEGEAQLYIARAPAQRRNPERLAIITPHGHGWAEGSAEDVTAQGDVIVEDYKMQIYRIAA